jgi:hypothetical protein
MAPAYQQRPAKPVKLILRVDAQGPEGLWMQVAKDLTPAELTQLRSLIVGELAKISNHRVVSADTKEDVLGLLVVAAKLQVGRETCFVLSNVVTIAKAKGTDVFVTHDVVAEPDLALSAKAVVGSLVSAELRGVIGYH